ncbi:hypothetical protein ACQKL6_18260 [Peribacillus sp. NPDC097197]|uniref:hypothetical protein n=1 Tax=Peribacillus sp. NPDC097197 TaxID=3390615 RepID=UPI003D058F61
MDWGDFTIDNSEVIFNLTTPYTKALHDNFGNIKSAVKIKNSNISAVGAKASHVLTGSATSIDISIGNTFTNFEIT